MVLVWLLSDFRGGSWEWLGESGDEKVRAACEARGAELYIVLSFSAVALRPLYIRLLYEEQRGLVVGTIHSLTS